MSTCPIKLPFHVCELWIVSSLENVQDLAQIPNILRILLNIEWSDIVWAWMLTNALIVMGVAVSPMEE